VIGVHHPREVGQPVLPQDRNPIHPSDIEEIGAPVGPRHGDQQNCDDQRTEKSQEENKSKRPENRKHLPAPSGICPGRLQRKRGRGQRPLLYSLPKESLSPQGTEEGGGVSNASPPGTSGCVAKKEIDKSPAISLYSRCPFLSMLNKVSPRTDEGAGRSGYGHEAFPV